MKLSKELSTMVSQADKLKEEKESLEAKLKVMNEKVSMLEKIEESIKGLIKTAKEEEDARRKVGAYDPKKGYRTYYDAGKYDTAYYFVAEIREDNIIASKKFKPALYEKCPKCNKKVPLLMWYSQTYDSPEGDTWEKEAFTICLDCKTRHKIKRIARDNRF